MRQNWFPLRLKEHNKLSTIGVFFWQDCKIIVQKLFLDYVGKKTTFLKNKTKKTIGLKFIVI